MCNENDLIVLLSLLLNCYLLSENASPYNKAVNKRFYLEGVNQ